VSDDEEGLVEKTVEEGFVTANRSIHTPRVGWTPIWVLDSDIGMGSVMLNLHILVNCGITLGRWAWEFCDTKGVASYLD